MASAKLIPIILSIILASSLIPPSTALAHPPLRLATRIHTDPPTGRGKNTSVSVPRSNFIKRTLLLSTAAIAIGTSSSRTTALAFSGNDRGTTTTTAADGKMAAVATGSADGTSEKTVTYRSFSLDMPGYGVQVPVAMWSPSSVDGDGGSSAGARAVYSHRISLQKIGKMLLGSDFIPGFLSKDFSLDPTYGGVLGDGGDGGGIGSGSGGSSAPVIILAHGYLGSRFDLSHFGEALAREGFTCISPEYPESLAASYTTTPPTPSTPTLDRSTITTQLLTYLHTDLNLSPTSYGILGHSLGCGTALSTGDSTWTRVCIAGPAVPRNNPPLGGNTLSIVSLGDGLTGGDRARVDAMVPPSFVRLVESSLPTAATGYPSRATLIMDRPDAPNHISFLAGSVNDSMVSFLSPLLPVAQLLGIPVLDFDRYKESRDSVETAGVTVPLVCGFFGEFLV